LFGGSSDEEDRCGEKVERKERKEKRKERFEHNYKSREKSED